MKSKLSFLFTSLFFVFILFSCDEDSTSSKSDFPDDVTEFASGEQAAMIAESTIEGIGTFAISGLDMFERAGQSLAKPQGDTVIVYYDEATGWWIEKGELNWSSESGTSLMEVDNKHQFLKGDIPQKWYEGADKMHTIMNFFVTFTYLENSNEMDYFLDLIYSDIQSEVMIYINGEGHFDTKFSYSNEEQTQKGRYYLIYKFENLGIPLDEGYPTGKMIVRTKNFTISITFNGTNTAQVEVTNKGGSVVYSGTYELDDEDYTKNQNWHINFN